MMPSLASSHDTSQVGSLMYRDHYFGWPGGRTLARILLLLGPLALFGLFTLFAQPVS